MTDKATITIMERGKAISEATKLIEETGAKVSVEWPADMVDVETYVPVYQAGRKVMIRIEWPGGGEEENEDDA